jgi:hypothetical protein
VYACVVLVFLGFFVWFVETLARALAGHFPEWLAL